MNRIQISTYIFLTMEVTRRRRRRNRKLLDDLKDRRGYSHSKEEALDPHCVDESFWRRL